MKIIYTNLQENDAGVLRSLRQLRVDFDGNDRGQVNLPQCGERDGAGHDDGSLLSHAGLSDRRHNPARPGHTPCGGNEEDRGKPQSLQENASPTFRDARSVAHLLVRRFVEAQLRSAHNFERRNRINITV